MKLYILNAATNEQVEKELPDECIPKDSFFDVMRNTSVGGKKDSSTVYKTGLTTEEFEVIYNFLVKKLIPKHDYFSIIDEYQLSPYISSLIDEIDMRENMYDPEYSDHPMNTDPLYALIPLTENLWNGIVRKIRSVQENESRNGVDPNLLFRMAKLTPSSFNEIQKKIKLVKELTNLGNIFVAGGSVFSVLFDAPTHDIDLFIYGLSEEDAKKKICEIYRYLESKRENNNEDEEYGMRKKAEKDPKVLELGAVKSVYRSINSITFNCNIQVQVILRLYRTPSEIIHSFDIDGCCMGTDGSKIYITKRCLHALENGYNTVNFERLSPSYTRRLTKYAIKGLKVYDPGFQREKSYRISEIDYMMFHNVARGAFFTQTFRRVISERLEGLNYLLYVEGLIERRGIKGYNTLILFEGDCSDYGSEIVENEIIDDCRVIKAVKSDNMQHFSKTGKIWVPNKSITEEESKREKRSFIVSNLKEENFSFLFNPKTEIEVAMNKYFAKIYKIHSFKVRNNGLWLSVKDYNQLKVKLNNILHGLLDKDFSSPSYKDTDKVKSLLNSGYKRLSERRINNHIAISVSSLSDGRVDYVDHINFSNNILHVVEYLKSTCEEYQDKSKQYIPYLKRLKDVDYYYSTPCCAIISFDKVKIKDLKSVDVTIDPSVRTAFITSTNIYGEINKSEYHYKKENSLINFTGFTSDEFFEDRHGKIQIHPHLYKKMKEFTLVAKDLTGMNFETNSMTHKEFNFVKGSHLFDVMNINEDLYEVMKIIKKTTIPRCVSFKVTNPGEQMTSTFNRMVLKDEKQWYDGPYYKY